MMRFSVSWFPLGKVLYRRDPSEDGDIIERPSSQHKALGRWRRSRERGIKPSQTGKGRVGTLLVPCPRLAKVG